MDVYSRTFARDQLHDPTIPSIVEASPLQNATKKMPFELVICRLEVKFKKNIRLTLNFMENKKKPPEYCDNLRAQID